MQGVNYATAGRNDRGELTPFGELMEAYRAACAIKSDTAVATARAALDAFHAQNGTRGRALPTRETAQPIGTRGYTSRPSTPAPSTPTRGRPGASAAADLRAISATLASMTRTLAGLTARRQTPAALDDEDALELALFGETTEAAEQQRYTRLYG